MWGLRGQINWSNSVNLKIEQYSKIKGLGVHTAILHSQEQRGGYWRIQSKSSRERNEFESKRNESKKIKRLAPSKKPITLIQQQTASIRQRSKIVRILE